MSNNCSCSGVLRVERWGNVVWDECGKCGAKWDERTVAVELTTRRRSHLNTMERIRDEVAHTCDGPLTPFVHMSRVLGMVHANRITSDEGANYLSEVGLLNESEDDEEMSFVEPDASMVYYGIGGQCT